MIDHLVEATHGTEHTMPRSNLYFFFVHPYPSLSGKEKKYFLLTFMGVTVAAVVGLDLVDPQPDFSGPQCPGCCQVLDGAGKGLRKDVPFDFSFNSVSDHFPDVLSWKGTRDSNAQINGLPFPLE